MLKISLEDIRFQGAHGVYPEEQVLGNVFAVDAAVMIPDPGTVTALSQTVDYEKVYEILREVMGSPGAMLETLADRSVERIREAFPRARKIEVCIAKLNPPLGGEVGRSVVSLSREYPGQ